MKRTLLVVTLIPTLCLAENLFKNSTMDTQSNWGGDRRFDLVEGNRVMVLEANKNKPVAFHQDADSRNLKDLTLKHRSGARVSKS